MVDEPVKGSGVAIAVQVLLGAGLSPGAEVYLRADAGIRVPVLNFKLAKWQKVRQKA